MAPWIEDILIWVKSLSARVAKLLAPAADAVTKAIHDNAHLIEGDAVTFFEDAAKEAVSTAAASTGTAEEKAGVALTTFFGILASKGITWGTNVAKILLESAYANWKASQGLAIDAPAIPPQATV